MLKVPQIRYDPHLRFRVGDELDFMRRKRRWQRIIDADRAEYRGVNDYLYVYRLGNLLKVYPLCEIEWAWESYHKRVIDSAFSFYLEVEYWVRVELAPHNTVRSGKRRVGRRARRHDRHALDALSRKEFREYIDRL